MDPGRGEGGANPRFVVTSLKPCEIAARPLYEKLYCARGDMENRIKECQLDLFADRTSAATMRANQLRLWFASMAYALLSALRRRACPRRARACHLRGVPAAGVSTRAGVPDPRSEAISFGRPSDLPAMQGQMAALM
jgi:hypothetical protein